MNIVLFLSIDSFELRFVHIRLCAFDVYTPTFGFTISGQPQSISCHTLIYWEANKCLRTHNYDSNANHDSFHHEIELSEKKRESEWKREESRSYLAMTYVWMLHTQLLTDDLHTVDFFILFIVTVRCLHVFNN